MAKWLIFSDLHFGDPLCSLRNETIAKGLRAFLRDVGEVDELILAGDILDANVSSLSKAIKGKPASGPVPQQLGLQRWLSLTFEKDKFEAKKIVYVPGNHDYKIWDILSTNKAFVQPLSKGLIPQNLPLMQDKFPQPFIRGVAPKKIQDRFIVDYPDRKFSIGKRSVLVTHGHYLDHKQSLFKGLDDFIKEKNGDIEEAVRNFFIRTAMYQAAANSVSYTPSTRTFVDDTHKKISRIFSAFGKLRGKRTKDPETLHAIELYLLYFRKEEPDIFIFGHTHKPGRSKTSGDYIKKEIDVWNDGSFIEDEKCAGTFILADGDETQDKQVKLYQVDLQGNVSQKRVKIP